MQRSVVHMYPLKTNGYETNDDTTNYGVKTNNKLVNETPKIYENVALYGNI